MVLNSKTVNFGDVNLVVDLDVGQSDLSLEYAGGPLQNKHEGIGAMANDHL